MIKDHDVIHNFSFHKTINLLLCDSANIFAKVTMSTFQREQFETFHKAYFNMILKKQQKTYWPNKRHYMQNKLLFKTP